MEETFYFLTAGDIISIHDSAIKEYGGPPGLRDYGLVESAAGAPKATYEGKYLMGLFEMAATYAVSISMNHPFIDGNKRTAALAATIFLYMNGYLLHEGHDEELANTILEIIDHKIDKTALTEYFTRNCKIIE